MSTSKIETFSNDYRLTDEIDTNSWAKRKIYDNSPFLVMPSYKFFIRLGSLLPSFFCYVRINGEQFGDSLPCNLTNSTIAFKLYNSSGEIVLVDTCTISNPNLGEVRYDWKEFDITQKDIYNFEIEVTDITSLKSFVLPEYLNKYQIIVN